MLRLALALLILPVAAMAEDIVIIGEVHDNPAHHAEQARLVAELQPAAIVFEMLTPEQAAEVTPANRADARALGAALGWEASGWPDFAMYHPIFTAAPGAAIHGAALPRAEARAAADRDVAVSFGADAPAYGLTTPLDEAEQDAREAMQADAHCGALPDEALPGMVALQRLRDAFLAREALRALAANGAPVVVITGNGHARADWGVPAVLARAMPELDVRVILQGEDGRVPDGAFDEWRDAPGVDREDPCAAFAE